MPLPPGHEPRDWVRCNDDTCGLHCYTCGGAGGWLKDAEPYADEGDDDDE